MLTAHVRTTYLKGMPHATYMGYVRCRTHAGTMWTESAGVHSLTKADAKALAEKLVDYYHALSHNATKETTDAKDKPHH